VARTLWISPGTVRSISRTRTRSWASTAVRRPSPRCSAATARRPDGPTA
jgi:hypothetical protein